MWKIKLLWVAIVTLFITGCLRDDLSECDQGVELIFEYTHHNYQTDLFDKEVKQITVFAFDDSGKYVEMFSCKTGDMPAKRMALPLPGGNYTFITCGGTLDSYMIGESGEGNSVPAELKKGVTSIEQFRLQIQADNSRESISVPYSFHPTDLYYNKKEIRIIPGQKMAYPINLIKNSSIVRFLIKEISDTPFVTIENEETDFPYTIHLSGTNTRIDSENNIPEDAPRYRHPELTMEMGGDNLYQADYRMMRLMRNHPVELTIEDKATGTVLLDENLQELILQNSAMFNNQSDLDKEDLFLIELDVDRGPLKDEITVTVRINGWTIIKTKPVL